MNTETRQSICIIDDDKVQSTLLGMMLSGDYDVTYAASGTDGLALVRSKKPDLVLLDVMMPDIDGLDVCEQLKADPNTQDIPIVFLTGLENASDQEKGFELGADDYISKPVSAGLVKARVARILNVRLYIEFLERMLTSKNESIDSLKDEAQNILGRKLG
jgi:putative two-component system response regulator